MNNAGIFRKYTLNENQSQTVLFGDKFLTLKRTEKGWYLNTTDTAEDILVENMDYFQTGISDSIILAPALQDKPLVFKGKKIAVLPEQRITFFLKIPVVLKIYHTRRKEDNLLKELPFKKLSNTWFGDADKGEPAYSIGSDYLLDMPELEPESMEIICPVKVTNNSKIKLELERLILRISNLSIYQCNNQLITDLVKIEYKGKDVISSVSYSLSKGIHGENEVILTKPHIDGNSSSLKINFHFIKQMYRGI